MWCFIGGVVVGVAVVILLLILAFIYGGDENDFHV